MVLTVNKNRYKYNPKVVSLIIRQFFPKPVEWIDELRNAIKEDPNYLQQLRLRMLANDWYHNPAAKYAIFIPRNSKYAPTNKSIKEHCRNFAIAVQEKRYEDAIQIHYQIDTECRTITDAIQPQNLTNFYPKKLVENAMKQYEVVESILRYLTEYEKMPKIENIEVLKRIGIEMGYNAEDFIKQISQYRYNPLFSIGNKTQLTLTRNEELMSEYENLLAKAISKTWAEAHESLTKIKAMSLTILTDQLELSK